MTRDRARGSLTEPVSRSHLEAPTPTPGGEAVEAWPGPPRNAVDVLIVEDNEYDVELTTHALKDHHLAERIKAVRDGAEALDFIFGTGDYARRDPTQRPKLILLDLNLPKVSGLEVLRRIRADPTTHEIPVVILTHSDQDSNVVEGYRLGANSFLVKHHDFEEFVKGILTLGAYWIAMNKTPIRPPGGRV
jgi:two-component system, response regulator